MFVGGVGFGFVGRCVRVCVGDVYVCGGGCVGVGVCRCVCVCGGGVWVCVCVF